MTRTVGQVAGSDYKNKGEFTLSFWASLYADDAATPLASREALLAVTNEMYDRPATDHLRLFGLLMHVGANCKRSKTEAIFSHAKSDSYSAGDTSDLLLDCGGTISFAESRSCTSDRCSTSTCPTTMLRPSSRRCPRPPLVRYAARSSALATSLGGSWQFC